MSRRARGFTLLEILVVLVVLGLLVTLLARGVDFGLLFADRQAAAIAARGALEPVDRALRQLIENMDPGAAGISPIFDGRPHSLAFATELPLVPARQAEVALGVDGEHRLVLHWHALLASPPAIRTTTLLEGVERLDIGYWRPGGGGWLDAWHLHTLPALLRLRIVFPKGDPRVFPDLIAAPIRARPVAWIAPTAEARASG